MKTQVTLNIGLNNNPFTAEPTLVVKVSQYNNDDHVWRTIVRMMNTLYTQECIPFRLVSTDADGFESITEGLVYNGDFRGETYEFDGKYFIEM
jgi:hypothetical protein